MLKILVKNQKEGICCKFSSSIFFYNTKFNMIPPQERFTFVRREAMSKVQKRLLFGKE